jgi:hypothetical protein
MVVAMTVFVISWVIFFGFTDPAAGLLMSPLIAYEGTKAWRGQTCCDSCN